MKLSYVLDTNICSFIMREQPKKLLMILEDKVSANHSIVTPAVTCTEMKLGAVGTRVRAKHEKLVNRFLDRVDEVLALDQEAIEESARVKKFLISKETLIGNHETLIAGHALVSNIILLTINIRHFDKVPNLQLEDWVNMEI